MGWFEIDTRVFERAASVPTGFGFVFYEVRDADGNVQRQDSLDIPPAMNASNAVSAADAPRSTRMADTVWVVGATLLGKIRVYEIDSSGAIVTQKDLTSHNGNVLAMQLVMLPGGTEAAAVWISAKNDNNHEVWLQVFDLD